MTITVLGTPAPQGSLRAFMPKGGRFPVVTSDNLRTRPWKQAVTVEARAAWGENTPAITDPVTVSVLFYLPRPKTATRRILEPAKKPDLDKLVRAILDAFTDAGVWVDDSQVVAVTARKAFAGGARDKATGVPRALISVKREEPTP